MCIFKSLKLGLGAYGLGFKVLRYELRPVVFDSSRKMSSDIVTSFCWRSLGLNTVREHFQGLRATEAWDLTVV